MKSYPLLTVLLLAISLGSLGQVTGLTLKHIGTESGLSQSNVTCILQDSRGFMWFGTRDGLNKYDGYQFTVYKNVENDGKTISNNFITSIIEDVNGELWIGTWGGGINRFDRKKDRFTQCGPPFSNIFINRLMQDSRHNIWVCSDGQGLFRLEPETGKYKQYLHDKQNPHSLGDNDIYTIIEDRHHDLWIGTSHNGLSVFDGKTDSFRTFRHSNADTSSLSNDAVAAIFEDSRSRIWIGTQGGGLELLEDRRGKFRHFLRGRSGAGLIQNVIQCILDDDGGNLWIGADNGGLSIISPSLNSCRTYYQDYIDNGSLSNNSVNSLYKDSQGNMWVGTYSGGVNLHKSNNDNFLHYRHSSSAASLSNNNVLDILEDKDQNVWIGTDGGGLDLLDRKTGAFRHFRHTMSDNNSIGGNYVLTLHEDHLGNLWMGSWGGGVSVLNKSRDRCTRYKSSPRDTSSLSSNNIYSVTEDIDNVVWIGTYGGGLDKYEPSTHSFVHYRHDPSDPGSIGSDRVHAMLADREGVLWIGTFDAGLDRLDKKTNTFTHFCHSTVPGTLSNNSINSIFEDSRGDIWIGTADGLDHFDRRTSRFTSYSTKDGLPGTVIFGILEDDKNNLWLSTIKGLARFNLQTHSCRNFTTDDGLQADEFKAHACFRSRSGMMYFGGVNGFNAFFPDSVKENWSEPPLVITGFQIFNKAVPVSDGDKDESPLKMDISETKDIELSYKHSVITVEFASLNYTYPAARRYRYRLAGFDKDWTYTDTKRSVTYTNLDPGTYTFRVEEMKGGGSWSDKSAGLRITIVPPFWLTWWFRVSLVLAVIAIAISIHRIRLHSIQSHRKELKQEVRERTAQLTMSVEQERKARREAEHANQVKSQFMANMSHELRTPMNAIIGFTDLALSSPLQKVQRDYIEHVSRAGVNLLGLINAVLDYSKIEAGKLLMEETAFGLARLVEETSDMLAIKAFEKGLEMVCVIDPGLPEKVLGDPLRIQQILVNLIGNAIKFTEKGEVVVTIRQDGAVYRRDNKKYQAVSIFVRDTGIGIPADKLDKIFESFTQGDSSTTRKYGGTGLGLTIARNLAEMMGGNLEVKSQVGEGSLFILHLPLEIIGEALVRETGKRPALRHILVVDDNATNCRLMQDIFYQMKIDCTTAASGKEALEILTADSDGRPPFDLIITDYQMPSMDGITLVKTIKAVLNGRTQPFILMLSSLEKNMYREEAQRIGIDLFLSKPVKAGELDKILAGIFEGQEAEPFSDKAGPAVAVQEQDVRILVAEDDPVNMLLITEVLSKMGYEVIKAGDGKEVLNLLQTVDPALIFMDINMPEMDGYMATRLIRELPGPKCAIPIIALTADAMKEDKERCVEAGMNGFVSKPFRREEIDKEVRRFVGV